MRGELRRGEAHPPNGTPYPPLTYIVLSFVPSQSRCNQLFLNVTCSWSCWTAVASPSEAPKPCFGDAPADCLRVAGCPLPGRQQRLTTRSIKHAHAIARAFACTKLAIVVISLISFIFNTVVNKGVFIIWDFVYPFRFWKFGSHSQYNGCCKSQGMGEGRFSVLCKRTLATPHPPDPAKTPSTGRSMPMGIGVMTSFDAPQPKTRWLPVP